MSEGRKVSILQRVLGSFYLSGTERLFLCPKCGHHKRKLSVNIEKDVFKCWVCDYHGISLRKLIRKYGTFKELSEWSELTNEINLDSFSEDLFAEEEEREQVLDLPKEFVSLTNKNLPITCLRAKNYLLNRGITKEDIIRWKIGFCLEGEYANRVVIPSFGITGRPNYFIARTYADDWKKYKNPPVGRNIIFNHLYLDFDEDLNIVEGVFDAIKAGPNSVPILGSTLRERSKLFQEIVKNDTVVYVALDPDAEKKSMHLIKKLLNYGIEVYKVDIKPYNDVGEMTREEYVRRKEQSTLMDSSNYLLKTLMSV